MSKLIRDPWHVLNDFNHALDNLRGTSCSDTRDLETFDWKPRVDVHEDLDAYLINVDVPGVKPEDIHVTMDKNTLTIKGERHHEVNTDDKQHIHRERVTGKFYRSFSLPTHVNGDAIDAKAEHGVLHIRIPKADDPKERRIEVKG